MNAIFEKELPESEKLEIVRGIIKTFREKGVSFGQAFELLSDAQLEIQKISLEPKILFAPADSSGTIYSAESSSIARPITSHE